VRGVFQATIVDSVGAVIPNANIEVRDEVSGELVQVYEEFEAGDALGNPFTADDEGFTRFYLEDGLYKVRAYSGVVERIWRHVHVGLGTLLESGSFTGTLTGMTGSVTGEVFYRRVATHVRLFTNSAFQGASNQTFMQMTGLPAGLSPATAQNGLTWGVQDNGVQSIACHCSIQSGTTTITFGRATVVGSNVVAPSGFTASGTKGLMSGWSFEFDIA
jgi:hypothetical protein